MRKYLSSIFVIIICFIASYRFLFPPACSGLIDGIWLTIWCIILILYLVLLITINIYQKVRYRKVLDYTPYFSLVLVFVVTGFVLFFKSETFKSKRVLIAKSYWQELILRQDKSYELIGNEPEFSCKEEGGFKISNDTLYLFENPGYDKTLIYNEKYLINFDKKILNPIVNDSIDNGNIFKITQADLININKH